MKSKQLLLSILVFLCSGFLTWAQDSENCSLMNRWTHGPCFTMDAAGFKSGIYFYQIHMEDYRALRK